MLVIRMDPELAEKKMPFGFAEVQYPSRDQLEIGAFRSLVEQELAQMKQRYEQYDRKAVFGEDAYVRFFKRFKKTYPVMQQFESVLLKGRPFPNYNPVTDPAFLMELTTHVLSGTHDVDRIEGELTLTLGKDKTPFPGLRGVEFHTYPGDMVGRDRDGIIFSMIAGADARTCAQPDSCHVLYPVFGTPDMPEERIQSALEVLVGYVRILCPEAEIITGIL